MMKIRTESAEAQLHDVLQNYQLVREKFKELQGEARIWYRFYRKETKELDPDDKEEKEILKFVLPQFKLENFFKQEWEDTEE